MSTAPTREIFITGGGRGIGRAIALRFAEPGARIFINFFVNGEAAEKTAHEVELRGARAHLLQGDLKQPAEIQRMFDEVGRLAGRLDVLVSNAASGVLRDALTVTAKQLDWVLATNARPLLLTAQAAAAFMGEGGRVIALSSLGSQRVIPGYAAVGVSKADVYLQLGLIHHQLGEGPKAKSMYERGLELEPTHSGLKAALAEVK